MGTLEGITFDTTYYPVAVVSCAFFLWVFRYISPSLSAKICPTFKKLSEAKQIDWHSRVNSSLHAAVVSCMCAYALLYEEELNEEPIWWNKFIYIPVLVVVLLLCSHFYNEVPLEPEQNISMAAVWGAITCPGHSNVVFILDDSPIVRSSCAIVIGYMAADAMLMVIYYKQIGETFYFFHHAATVYAYYHVMTYGILPYFANYRLMAEFSTPLVNNRWFMDTLGFDKSGVLYMGNGSVMTAIFFACRILNMPQYWYTVYSVYGTEKFIKLGNLQYVLIISCFVLDLINLFWFYKLCKGIHKMMAKKKAVEMNSNLAIKKLG